MPQKDLFKFLNGQKKVQKELRGEKKGFYEGFSFNSFFKITPAWQSGKNYALIQIRPREFKLFEKGGLNLKWLKQYTSQLSLYVNSEGYNNEMQHMLNYTYENKQKFKEQMDRRLGVY